MRSFNNVLYVLIIEIKEKMFEQNIEGLPSGCINGDEDWRRSTQAKPTPLSAKSVLKINLKKFNLSILGRIWRRFEDYLKKIRKN